MCEKKKTPLGQGVLSMALANFDSWLRSPRTILMLLFIAAICYLQMCGYEMKLTETGYTMHLGETLFYEFKFGCNMPMTNLRHRFLTPIFIISLFLIMVSELPRRIAYQQYSLIRSSRCRWMAAQLLYCLMMVVAMIALIALFIALMALPLVTPGNGWSDAARIASGEIEPYEALISEFILNNYTPFTATLLAMIPVFCFWLTMVFVILMFGVWGSPVFGVLMYAFLMVANVTILFEAFPFQLILPIQYATLDNIISSYDGKEIQQFLKVMGVYAALIVSLVAVMMISVKRVELNFHAESKQ